MMIIRRIYKMISCALFVYVLQICFSSVFLFGETSFSPVDGRVDLSDYDFDSSSPVVLNGKWSFSWNEMNADRVVTDDTLEVPGAWNHQYSVFGFGTYNLKIRLPEGMRKYALSVPQIGTAYRLYINGKEIAGQGNPGKSRKDTRPRVQPVLADFEAEGTTEISIETANFYDREGGIWNPVVLGLEKDLRLKRERSLALQLFFIGIILMISFYHLILFVFNRKEKSFIFFSICTAMIGLKALLEGQRFILILFPALSYSAVFKLWFLSYYLAIPFFYLFIQSQYPESFNRYFTGVFLGISAVFSLIVLIFPTYVFTFTLPYYHIITISGIIYVFAVFVKLSFQRQAGAGLLFSAFIILLAAVINDMLQSLLIIQTMFISPIGFFVMILAQSMIFSKRFSKQLIAEHQRQSQTDHLKYFAENKLTKRETEIAEKLVEGKSYQEISEVLFISVNTIKYHASHIYKKCDVKNRVELAHQVEFQ